MKNLFVITLFILSVTIVSAQDWWKDGIRGEGPSVSQDFSLDNIDGISLQISGDLYLKQGNTQSVKIEGQQNIISNIKTEVDNGYWKIRFDKPVRKHDKIKVYVTLPTIKAAKVAGAGDIIGQNKFSNLKDLVLYISGSGNIKFEADAEDVELKISGSGDMDVKGMGNSLALSISGSGNIDAVDLAVKSCSVKIAGSGDCKINVQENLEARISGSGGISYKGRPRISSKISGSGGLNSI